MTAGRGRVLKAGRVAAAAGPVPWEPRAAVDDAPPAEIEVVRERGVVVAITVKCRCGRAHELELVPGDGNEGKKGA
jgi:hypothetical protein